MKMRPNSKLAELLEYLHKKEELEKLEKKAIDVEIDRCKKNRRVNSCKECLRYKTCDTLIKKREEKKKNGKVHSSRGTGGRTKKNNNK